MTPAAPAPPPAAAPPSQQQYHQQQQALYDAAQAHERQVQYERRISQQGIPPGPQFYGPAGYLPYAPQPGPSRAPYFAPSPQLPPQSTQERSATFGSGHQAERTMTSSSSGNHPSPPSADREHFYQHQRAASIGNDLTRDPMLTAYFDAASVDAVPPSPLPTNQDQAAWDSFTSSPHYAEDSGYVNGNAQGRESGESDHLPNSQHDARYHGRHPDGPRPMLPPATSYFGSPVQPSQRPFSAYDAYGMFAQAPLQPRKSFESARAIPTPGSMPHQFFDQRSLSMTAIQAPRPVSMQSQPQIVSSRRQQPLVYPALLSRVAEIFRVNIQLSELSKDGLSYTNAFEGRQAVDIIAYIIKTTDRNLALLLGRALDAQKFFHDVTYDHRLRDSSAEIYQFRERLSERFTAADDALTPAEPLSASNSMYSSTATTPQRRPSVTDTMLSDDSSSPSGVFTLLTECYSPTCTRDRLCYSIACPRRLEQQARLKLKPQPGLRRTTSHETLDDDAVAYRRPGENQLWSHIVSKEVLEATPEREVRRQEAINELIYTECDFVRDLEYMRDSWIGGLRKANVIPSDKVEDFITQVFWNVLDVHQVNNKLCDQLLKRQKQYAGQAVERIADILQENVPNFGPFVAYGAHQLYGKYEFEKEKTSNPAFAKFVDDVERLPESRKLELNGYLTKPTTRLARYPLLLEVVLKHTPDDHPDKVAIPKVVASIRKILSRVNEESGKSENRFSLQILDSQLVWKQADTYVDLKLRDENRELVFKGGLRRRGGAQGGENAELQVFLFDHAVLMVKQKANAKAEQLKVYRKPIPLELLIVTTSEDPTGKISAARPKSLISRTSTGTKSLTNTSSALPSIISSKNGFGIIFTHLGRRGYQMTLWSPSDAGRKKWLEKIEERQNILKERSLIFDTTIINEGYFVGANRIICAASFDNGDQLIYGTDNGIYLADLRSKRAPVKVIALAAVTQLDIIEEHGILVVLADRALQTFLIDALDPADAVGASKRAKKFSTGANFFKVGQCLNRTLICVVKSGTVSSTIKAMEPTDTHRGSRKQPILRKLTQNQELLRAFKEFYLPHPADSIHFLKSKLCVGGARGFEIVDLETLDTQGLLDPSDSKLDFVQKRENTRPLAIYRVESDFLLCYQDFAFYVNKNGWRSRGEWIVHWEGSPTAFESGALMQIIPGASIKYLFSDIQTIAPAIPPYAHIPPPPGYFGPPPFQQHMAPPYYPHQAMYGNGHPPMPIQPPPGPIARGPSFRPLPPMTRAQIVFSMEGGSTVCRLSLATH